MARGSLVWFNGKIVPAESAKISLFTHALHYGDGAFEGIRAYKQSNGRGAVFRLKEHIERLFDSAKILNLTIPYSIGEIASACIETCKANQFQECYIRPIIFVGDGPLGVDHGPKPPVWVAILNWEWGSYLGDKGVEAGVKLMTSAYIRPHPASIMTKGKITGQYVTGVLAKREAISLGFDEALLLDPDGYFAEGTGENLFILKNGVIKTPPPTSILNGITRQTVIEHLSKKGGVIIKEQRFTKDELWCADEVFLTGTAAEITPVAEVDRRPIGRGEMGPFVASLKKEFQQMIRGDLPSYGKHWLTPIE